MTEILHGTVIRDPFRGLERGGDEDVRAWVSAEDATARAFVKALPMRASLADSIRKDDAHPEWLSLPVRRGGAYTYARRDPGRSRGAILRLDPHSRREVELLDLDRVAGDETLVADSWSISRDGHYVVLRLSPNGSDAVEARVFDLRTRAWLPERITDTRHAYPVWDSESRGFYYTWSPADPGMPPDKRAGASEIRHHVVGTDCANDRRVREAPHVDGVIEVGDESPDGRWLIAARWTGTLRDTLFLRDTRSPTAEWRRITPEDESRYDCTFAEDALYVWTTEGAPRGHLFRVLPAHPERAQWREVVPEGSGTLRGVDVIGDHLVLEYLLDAERRFEVRRKDGARVRELGLQNGASVASVAGLPWGPEGAASVGSYTEPYAPYTMRAPAFELARFGQPAPAPATTDRYAVEKTFYTSPDGTRAPVFVVRARTTAAREPAPLILNAYGAYGMSTLPGYRRGLEAWLDRGGVYAEAVIRGGGEYGEAWHLAGMGKNRVNHYADFIAASEHLIHERRTDPTRLVIRGISDGGLLVAVAMTERPDLYAGVICSDPVTDMVRYPLFGNGRLWGEELGRPDQPDELPLLLRYSPYHRVAPGAHYPWVLVQSSAADDRVDPMHARKLVAALKAADPAGTFLLRTEANAAHGGANTADAWVEAEADVYAFALAAVSRGRVPLAPSGP